MTEKAKNSTEPQSRRAPEHFYGTMFVKSQRNDAHRFDQAHEQKANCVEEKKNKKRKYKNGACKEVDHISGTGTVCEIVEACELTGGLGMRPGLIK